MVLNFGQSLFKNKRVINNVLTIAGSQFISLNPDTDQVTYSSGKVTSNEAGRQFVTSINLPNETTVISCKVSGTGSGTWSLVRNDFAGTNQSLAVTNMGSKDTTITQTRAFIDNDNYKYFIITPGLDSNEYVDGAIIEYTKEI